MSSGVHNLGPQDSVGTMAFRRIRLDTYRTLGVARHSRHRYNWSSPISFFGWRTFR